MRRRYNVAEDDEFEPMVTSTSSPIATCLTLTTAISKSRTVEEIYEAALDALRAGLGVERASILLFDADGVMRFKAYRGLSDAYRRAVEGHTPWQPDSQDPQPIWVSDVACRLPLLPARRVCSAGSTMLRGMNRTPHSTPGHRRAGPSSAGAV